MWVIWHITTAPCRWMRSANDSRYGRMRSWLISIWLKVSGESGATDEEPPKMVSASPPFAFSS
jgi:hypothetical protein